MTVTRKTTRRKIATANAEKAKCDELFRRIIYRRGRCERCGQVKARYECAHILSRELAAIRCDERNAWCLCSACHGRLTKYPHEHMEFVDATIGHEVFQELRDKAAAYGRSGLLRGAAFWRAERERLERRTFELGGMP